MFHSYGENRLTSEHNDVIYSDRHCSISNKLWWNHAQGMQAVFLPIQYKLLVILDVITQH